MAIPGIGMTGIASKLNITSRYPAGRGWRTQQEAAVSCLWQNRNCGTGSGQVGLCF
jgi:hypothetical protein